MLGHRAIWKDGWKAVTRHKQGEPFEQDHWFLYDTAADFAECHDVGAQHPQKLAELVAAWWTQAGRYNVLPLDDRGIELFVLRRPSAGGPLLRHRYLGGTPHVDRFTVPDIRNRSFSIRCRITRGSADLQGSLVASGARTGGYSLFVQNQRLLFAYNRIGQVTLIGSNMSLPVGTCEVAAEFVKTSEHTGTMTLLIEGKPVGSGTIALMPWRQSIMGMDIGADHGSTVCPQYEAPFRFGGVLHHVDFELGTDRDDVQRAMAIEARNALVDQ